MKLYKCQTFAKCDMPYCSTPAKFVFPVKGMIRKQIYLCDECAKAMYQALAKEQVPKPVESPFKKVKKVRRKNVR